MRKSGGGIYRECGANVKILQFDVQVAIWPSELFVIKLKLGKKLLSVY